MSKLYLPGEYICNSEGYIKGHGTDTLNETIVSTYLGTVSQINKLVTVTPKFTVNYSPEIGDVVIGRVLQIYNKKWWIDTNSKLDTTLSLSAINLPGVIQRRKCEEDEINMSKFFDFNDLLVCEVQKVNKSGSAALHTRNEKYGKLENGILVKVFPDLLVPMKQRFISKGPLNIIGGCNGWIWISTKEIVPETLKLITIVKTVIESHCSKNEKIDLEEILNTYC